MGREGSRGCERGRSLFMTYTRLKFGVYEAGRASGREARGSDAGAYGRGLPWGRGSMGSLASEHRACSTRLCARGVCGEAGTGEDLSYNKAA